MRRGDPPRPSRRTPHPRRALTAPPPPAGAPLADSNPDVVKDLKSRGTPIKPEDDLLKRGTAWSDAHNKHIAKDITKLSIYSSYERKYQ